MMDMLRSKQAYGATVTEKDPKTSRRYDADGYVPAACHAHVTNLTYFDSLVVELGVCVVIPNHHGWTTHIL